LRWAAENIRDAVKADELKIGKKNRADGPITQPALEQAGWQSIRWNPNYSGGYREYFESIQGGVHGGVHGDLRLSVRFDRLPSYGGREYMVYLVQWGVDIHAIPLFYVTTMQQLDDLHALLTGTPYCDCAVRQGK